MFEKGIKLLKEKGCLSYITSNKYVRVKYGKNIRQFLSEYYISFYNDYTDNKIFTDATVDTSVILIKKDNTKNNMVLINKEYYYNQENMDNNSWSFEKPEIMNLKEKILNQSILIKDKENLQINRGISTGCNEAFIVSSNIFKEINENETKLLKPIIRGKDLDRYVINYSELYLINMTWQVNLNQYINIKKYLLNYKEKLLNRPEVKENKYSWYCLSRYGSKYSEEFEKPKIIWQRVCKKPIFIFDESKSYLLDSMAFLTMKTIDDLKLTYIFLNTPIIEWYLNLIGHKYGNTGYLLSNQYVERLPIPRNIDKKTKDKLLKIVDNMDSSNDNIEKNQKLINKIVYQLYNLNDSEIKIIENNLE